MGSPLKSLDCVGYKSGGFPFYIPLRTLMVAIRLRAKHTESAQMTLRTFYFTVRPDLVERNDNIFLKKYMNLSVKGYKCYKYYPFARFVKSDQLSTNNFHLKIH